jgi:hypothetical protein
VVARSKSNGKSKAGSRTRSGARSKAKAAGGGARATIELLNEVVDHEKLFSVGGWSGRVDGFDGADWVGGSAVISDGAECAFS